MHNRYPPQPGGGYGQPGGYGGAAPGPPQYGGPQQAAPQPAPYGNQQYGQMQPPQPQYGGPAPGAAPQYNHGAAPGVQPGPPQYHGGGPPHQQMQQPQYGQPQPPMYGGGGGGHPMQPPTPSGGGYHPPQRPSAGGPPGAPQQPGMQPGGPLGQHQQPQHAQQQQPQHQQQQISQTVPALKTLQRAGVIVSWCPCESQPNLIALGTSQSATPSINADFSYQETPSKLEFCTFDLTQSHDQCSVIATCDFQNMKFLSLSWGAKDLDQGRFPYGLLCAAHPDGVLNLYDPAVIISSHGSDNGLLYSSAKVGGNQIYYTGCAAFHPNKSNVLAAGSRNCEVQIFNLSDPTQPEIHKQSGQTKMQGEIVDLAWNRKVPNIISSTSSNGVNVIWDLKTRGTCAEIVDPSHRQHIANVQWSPDCATQLIVAYDDDRLPGFQIWDLRQPSYPFREVNFGHVKGITKIAWNDTDPDLLLSTGRDNRTICWVLGLSQTAQTVYNIKEPEVYCDVTNVSNCVDVQFSPYLKGMVSTSSNTNGFGLFSILNNVQKSKYMPRCYDRDMDCGGSFGFGGKIAQFGSALKGAIYLHVVPSEPEIIGSADAFENWANIQDWLGYCQTKSRVEKDEYEKALWDFISLHINADDITSKQRIVTKLGYDLQEIANSAEQYLGHKPGSKWAEKAAAEEQARISKASMDQASNNGAPALPAFDEHAAEDFFSTMAQKEAQKKQEDLQLARKKEEEELQLQQKKVDSASDWNQGPELLIRQNFLVGSREAAVEICLKCGRVADALLIAYPEPELFAKVRDEYIQSQQDPFLSTIGNVVQNQLEALVCDSNLNNWKETLALLATYAEHDQAWRYLTEKLADRLEHEKFDVRSAVLCCVCSKNFGKTIQYWSSMGVGMTSSNPGASSPVNSQHLALQALVERMTVWQDITQTAVNNTAQNQPNSTELGLFTLKLTQYAELLANSGRMTSAMRQLQRLKNDPSSALLRHRIFHALPQEEIHKGGFQHPGEMPFQQVSIKVSPGMGGGMYGPGAGKQTGGKSGLPPTGPQGQRGMAASQKGMQQPPMGGPGSAAPPNRGIAPQTPARNPSMPTTSQQPMSHQKANQMPPVGSHMKGGMSSNPMTMTPSMNSGEAGRMGNPNSMMQPPMQNISNPMAMPPPATPTTNTTPMSAPGGPMGGSTANTSMMSGPPGGGGMYGASPQVGGMKGGGHMQPQMQPQQMSMGGGGPPPQQQQVMGSAVAGGRSTAPMAAAEPVIEGLPTPWPIPNPTQSTLHTNEATAGLNAQVNATQADQSPAAGGQPVWIASPADISTVKQGLEQLFSQYAQVQPAKRVVDDTRKRFQAIYDALESGQLNEQVGLKLIELAQSVSDVNTVKSIKQQLSSSTGMTQKDQYWLVGIHRCVTELEKQMR
ncbi:unnamed protein product [Amoebophrya sp. A120]|nr:unnamed protein product [Amoebophrya sp. A120]|eukprot:GSA120T00021926001.1